MSLTILWPGISAEKSRFTRSGIGPAGHCCVVDRFGRGWQDTRPSSRISPRTSSSPATKPRRASSVATLRYPYVESESSNILLMISATFFLLSPVALSAPPRHAYNPHFHTPSPLPIPSTLELCPLPA